MLFQQGMLYRFVAGSNGATFLSYRAKVWDPTNEHEGPLRASLGRCVDGKYDESSRAIGERLRQAIKVGLGGVRGFSNFSLDDCLALDFCLNPAYRLIFQGTGEQGLQFGADSEISSSHVDGRKPFSPLSMSSSIVDRLSRSFLSLSLASFFGARNFFIYLQLQLYYDRVPLVERSTPVMTHRSQSSWRWCSKKGDWGETRSTSS